MIAGTKQGREQVLVEGNIAIADTVHNAFGTVGKSNHIIKAEHTRGALERMHHTEKRIDDFAIIAFVFEL